MADTPTPPAAPPRPEPKVIVTKGSGIPMEKRG